MEDEYAKVIARKSAVDYESFVTRKSQLGGNHGFAPTAMPSQAFDFQQLLIDWALRKGRAAIFADCGLGKTLMQLAWADNVVRHTNKPVLLLTPLAVSYQTAVEAEKFGIDAVRCADGSDTGAHVVITNYERLHHFDRDKYAGVVCDESSILKSFDGATRTAVTEFMRKTRYRLLCTATAAPNDFIELGTSSEALGYLGHMDMLGRFFKNDQNSISPIKVAQQGGRANLPKWRFKGHAEKAFWQWVCSWARAVRKPSDIGCDDARFVLPELSEVEHVVCPQTLAPGALFSVPAIGLKEQREERRRSMPERVAKVAELVNGTGKPALVWCHLNDEGDMLEKSIDGAVQVSGKDSDEEKEEAFVAFVTGKVRVLVTKPTIGAWGLNFQHCAHETFFPSHSYEQYYQGVRRCWRFGQTQPVRIDVITSEGETGVVANLQRKAKQADRMFASLVLEMNRELSINRQQHQYENETRAPSWL